MATITVPAQTRYAQTSLLDHICAWVTPIFMMAAFVVAWYQGPQLDRLDLKIATFILMWIALGSSWNLVGGYTGYIDFGHSVFVGIGGYFIGIMTVRYGVLTLGEGTSLAEQREVLRSFNEMLPHAFIIGALFAGLIGLPTLRLKGPYFSIAMLGVLVAMREIARNNPYNLTNGGKGISFLAPFAEPEYIFHVMLSLAGLTFFVSLWMYRVQVGKMLKAVRDDEVGADMRGINTTAMKVGIFMLAGGFTAMVGGTKAYWDAYIDPTTIFPETYHIEIIMIVLLGGIGRPMGPVIGATLFYYGGQTIWANAGQQHLLITGSLLIALMLYMPGGVLSVLDPEDRGLAWLIRYWLLGQRDKVFDDDKNFEFQEIPDAPDVQVPAISHQLNKLAPGQELPIVLEGHHLSVDYGGLRALNQVDFYICKGEIVGLLGPNGSGKTTLFDAVCGLINPSEGNILVMNRLVTHRAPWQINRAGLARTFQRIRIYKKQTLFDNMLLARRWQGVPAWLWLWIAPNSVREKANDLINFLKIGHVQKNLAGNLSGGQQRLLEIGMTLMSDPVVVLLDEATSGVNPALVEDIKESILRANRERGVTFFIIEHNMNFAMELCSRLYVLDYGVKIAEGSPYAIQNNEQVIEAYFGRD